MLTDILFNTSLSSMLLTAVAILSIFWLWSKTRRPYTRYNIPPFPVSPMPIVGHLFQLRSNFLDKFVEWREQVGDIFSLDIGGRHQIVINGYDTIKEVLVNKVEYIPTTPHECISDILNENDKGIFGSTYPNWKEQRTVSLSILRNLGMGKNVLAEKIQEEVHVYLEKLAALKRRPKDIQNLTNASVSNIICAIIMGKRFDHEDPYFMMFINKLNDVIKYSTWIPIITAFPFLYSIPGDLFSINKWVQNIIDINNMFAKFYINEIKKTLKENEEPKTFIAAYLQEMKKKKDQGKPTRLDESNLVAIIRAVFPAGSETTSTTIVWCVLYMLHHPDIQEKVYREIEEHVGTERAPSIADKPKLTYLNAVIMETQRRSSLAPFAIRREVAAPFEMNGYTFPKGSIIWPNINSVLSDKKIWGDPENFRPERYFDDKGNLQNPEQLIPFSIGRRICLGEGLARMELFVFLSNMFQRFKFEPADKSAPLPTTESINGGTCSPHPFEVRFIERMEKI